MAQATAAMLLPFLAMAAWLQITAPLTVAAAQSAAAANCGVADCLLFLKSRLLRALGQQEIDEWERPNLTALIFLDNLKTSTSWVVKSVNIKMLVDLVERDRHQNLMHIATHFTNLIKVSEQVGVRHDAGWALLKVAPLLTDDQRNEIPVELVHGSEVGQSKVST